VRSPGPAELVELVRGPAAAAGLSFEEDASTGETLDERLLRDAERGDLLPLLQFTLNRLFEARDGAQLTFAADAALGGIEGTVDKEAESTISALPQEAQGASGPAELDIRPVAEAENIAKRFGGELSESLLRTRSKPHRGLLSTSKRFSFACNTEHPAARQ